MFQWRNIFISTKQDAFFQMKKALEDAEIPIKTEISVPNQSRMISGAMFGGNPLIMNPRSKDATMGEEYRIFVKKDQEEYALYIMGNYHRNETRE